MADRSKKTETTTLARSEAGALVPVPSENKITQMLQAVVDSGITADSAAAMKELAVLYREERAADARLAFNRALNAMQRELPTVESTRGVPDRNGNVKFVYASYEDIWEQVAPVLFRHGFSVGFNMRVSDNRVIVTCTLTHDDGHERSNECAVRIGGGAPGLSGGQEDGAAETSAKRRAFCAAINVPLNKDKDALVEGATISTEKADELARRAQSLVEAGHGSMAQWLALGGAEDWESVRAVKAGIVEAEMAKAEAKANVPPCPPTAAAWHDALAGMAQDKGTTPAAFSKWLADIAVKRGAGSYLGLTDVQRAEIWAGVWANKAKGK